MKCSRRIRPIVSTISIPHRPLHAKAGSRTNRKFGGQSWTPIPRLRGSFFHAGSHWRRIDLKRVIAERFGVEFHPRYVGKLLQKLGFSHISARPRHPAQDERIVEAFKKTSRTR